MDRMDWTSVFCFLGLVCIADQHVYDISDDDEIVKLRELDHWDDRREFTDEIFPDILKYQIGDEQSGHTLELKRNKHSDENSKVYVLTQNSDGTSTIDEQTNIENKGSAIYQDHGKGGIFTVKCFSTAQRRCKPNIMGSFYSGSQKYHVEALDDDTMTRELNDDDEFYLLRKINEPQHGDNDFINYDWAEDPTDTVRYRREIQRSPHKIAYDIELLMVLDYTIYKHWLDKQANGTKEERDNGAVKDIKQYYAHNINGVDLRFRSIDDDEFSFFVKLAGYIISKREEDSPWTLRNRRDLHHGKFRRPNRHSVDLNIIRDFRAWHNNASQHGLLPDHDHAMLWTRDNLMNGNMSGLAGFAYVGGICSSAKVSVVEELGGFSSVGIAAHELGHNLGAAHDTGQKCPSRHQFIMAPYSSRIHTQTENPWKFSSCSLEDFRKLLRKLNRLQRNCMIDDAAHSDANFANYTSQLPGQLYSVDEQCALLYREGATHCKKERLANDSVCETLWCKVHKGIGPCYGRSPAAMGTPCGEDKWCMKGVCVNISSNGVEVELPSASTTTTAAVDSTTTTFISMSSTIHSAAIDSPAIDSPAIHSPAIITKTFKTTTPLKHETTTTPEHLTIPGLHGTPVTTRIHHHMTTTMTNKPETTTMTNKPVTTTTTNKPGSTMTNKPATTMPKKPATTMINKPATTMTNKPATTMTNKPATTMTNKPATTMTNKPGSTMTNKPGSTMTNKPATTMTNKPANTMTNKPGSTMTNKPATTMTNKPGSTMTNKPVTTTTTNKPVTTTTTNKPVITTTTNNPVTTTTTHKPVTTTTTHKPVTTTTTHKPVTTTTTHKPVTTTTTHKPVTTTTTHKPVTTTTTHKPVTTTTTHKPVTTTTTHKPVTTTTIHKPVTTTTHKSSTCTDSPYCRLFSSVLLSMICRHKKGAKLCCKSCDKSCVDTSVYGIKCKDVFNLFGSSACNRHYIKNNCCLTCKQKEESCEDKSYYCRYMRQSLCYIKDQREKCCLTCKNKFGIKKECEDKTRSCSDIEAYECYSASTRRDCCKTCEQHKSSNTGCVYGDKTSLCKAITKNSKYQCYTEEENCCKTCPVLLDKEQKPDCKYGDKMRNCRSVTKDTTYKCYTQENDCCETCPRLVNKQADPGCRYGNLWLGNACDWTLMKYFQGNKKRFCKIGYYKMKCCQTCAQTERDGH